MPCNRCDIYCNGYTAFKNKIKNVREKHKAIDAFSAYNGFAEYIFRKRRDGLFPLEISENNF